MKKLNEVVTTLNQYKPETVERPDSTRAMKVWVQLADIFGKAFFREHGEQPGPLWVQAIHRLTDSQIAQGLAKLGNDGLQFPPNLSMFIEAAKRPKPVAPWRALPLPPADPQIERDKAWEQMEKLAGRKLRD